LGQGRPGPRAPTRWPPPARPDYCAYDHAGNIIGVLRDAGSAWRQIGSNDKAEAVKDSYVATQQ